jgi:hypothetical protein
VIVLQSNNEFIRISDLSQMGSCETRFVDAVKGRLFTTTAMKVGAVMHDTLAKSEPKLSPTEILDKIEGREEFWVTEMPIKDLVFMLSGRIDRLYMNGKVSNGKSQCIIIDHKYPREPYRSIPHYYAIQLVAYASCIEHSPIYGRRCKVVDAQLVSREKETHRVTSSVDMGESSLESGIRNMPELVKRAWEIKREESAPEHRRFNIVKGEWMECYCKVG